MAVVTKPILLDSTGRAMNENLARIADALGAQAGTTIAGIKRLVRENKGPTYFPVGSQFLFNHAVYGGLLCDVVDFDKFKPPRAGSDFHTMTLMAHNVINGALYSYSCAFYKAESELSAGTYHFTVDTTEGSWTSGDYQFTLTQAVPAGGVIKISSTNSTALTSLKAQTFRANGNANATTGNPNFIEQVNISSGNGGTALTPVYNWKRVSAGSDNYKESTLRAWLNSSASAGEWFSATTPFTMANSTDFNRAGFLNGLDADLVEAITACEYPCATNKVYEWNDPATEENPYPHFYKAVDKITIPCAREVGLVGSTLSTDDTSITPLAYFYNGGETVPAEWRIKVDADGVGHGWHTRSNGANASSYTALRIVGTNGSSGTASPNGGYYIAPMFTI